MHIRLHGSYGTDLGRSIAEVTDNIHAIGVVKPVYERSTFPLTATTSINNQWWEWVSLRVWEGQGTQLTSCGYNVELIRRRWDAAVL